MQRPCCSESRRSLCFFVKKREHHDGLAIASLGRQFVSRCRRYSPWWPCYSRCFPQQPSSFTFGCCSSLPRSKDMLRERRKEGMKRKNLIMVEKKIEDRGRRKGCGVSVSETKIVSGRRKNVVCREEKRKKASLGK
ncbi:tRN [Sesbania bispinosa]|nr:tRN [Sesbania bispinosa]